MANLQLLFSLNNYYSALTKSEKKFADFIMNVSNSEELYYESLSSMAKKSGVGEATIVRCLRHLGYNSFADFKLAVLKYSDINSPNIDNIEDDIFNKTVSLLNSVRESLNLDLIKKVAQLIATSKNVYFYGLGTSGYTAELAMFTLFRMGKESSAFTDSHAMNMRSSFMKNTDLVIILSDSGNSTDLIKPIATAKANDATTVLITSRINSILPSYADITIYTSGKDNVYSSIYRFESNLIQIYTLKIIFAEYERSNKDYILDSVNKSISSVTDLNNISSNKK